MRRSLFHSTVNIFMLCVMTLTSTGFTAVVGYCSMTHESTCCCEESTDHADTPTAGIAITDPIVSCYTRTIAGGLNAITATVQTENIQHIVALECIPVASFASAQHVQPRPLIVLPVNDAAPPGTDIYIRINSILI